MKTHKFANQYNKTKNDFVSVIVPIYNDSNNIDQCIKVLVNQTYPKDSYEVIAVDNGSTDDSVNIIKKYPVKLLFEKKIQSSYAARNKGIIHAKGEIIAFTDSDCIPSENWISEGIKKMDSSGADILGGKIEFYFSHKRTAAELYDSIRNMNAEKSINKNKVAPTANLFVKATLFKMVGLFPQHIQSGGDYQWTSKATKNGYLIIYAPNAIVKHPARTLIPLLKKQYRISSGALDIWIDKKYPILKIIASMIILLIPPNIFSLNSIISKRKYPYTKEKLFIIWSIGYLCNILGFFVRIKSISNYIVKLMYLNIFRRFKYKSQK